MSNKVEIKVGQKVLFKDNYSGGPNARNYGIISETDVVTAPAVKIYCAHTDRFVGECNFSSSNLLPYVNLRFKVIGDFNTELKIMKNDENEIIKFDTWAVINTDLDHVVMHITSGSSLAQANKIANLYNTGVL